MKCSEIGIIYDLKKTELITAMNRQEYLASLPKKIMGAGCLLFNTEGKILIVKPTYKDAWNLPGGVVEANESPRNACIRLSFLVAFLL
ncbi:MAG: hypothetical protein Tsb0014_16140 [Pleurocapsa sp.]